MGIALFTKIPLFQCLNSSFSVLEVSFEVFWGLQFSCHSLKKFRRSVVFHSNTKYRGLACTWVSELDPCPTSTWHESTGVCQCLSVVVDGEKQARTTWEVGG